MSASGIVISVLLGATVLLAWLAAAGFARLRAPLDRLHCVTFLNAACGPLLAVAALVSEGMSARAGKILVVVLAALLSGAATSHAIGRALRLRGSTPEAE